jgi:glutamate synthase (NADPH/NADH) large chain
LPESRLTVQLTGSAGQSLGAFLCQGVALEVVGDANDYVGKGLCGGLIVLRPAKLAPAGARNVIIGNTVLYGATSGRLFAAGQAGERFAVRNSGAEVVVEGCGANGCEYMTGGAAVLLGPVGDNFGAGMTGGMAFVYDPQNRFEAMANPETIIWRRIGAAYWEQRLRALVQEHSDRTASHVAQDLLSAWPQALEAFWQVTPKEMLKRLPHPLDQGAAVAAE